MAVISTLASTPIISKHLVSSSLENNLILMCEIVAEVKMKVEGIALFFYRWIIQR